MHKAYEKIVDRIIAAMERGICPWRRPWTLPVNLRGKCYRGINQLVLATCESADPRFVTYLQAQEAGGHVRKGESGFPVVWWHFPTAEEIEQNPKCSRHPFARTYVVFNVQQCEGLSKLPPVMSAERDSIAEAEAITTAWADRPAISHGGYRAAYNPQLDVVRMPEISKFSSAEGYYDTLFHELVHSTGHPSRLGRVSGTVARGESYAVEELVAEIGAAMLCSEVGISNDDLLENNAAYLQGWLRALRNDRSMLPQAAYAATKAVDMIVGGRASLGTPHNVSEADLLIAA